MRNFTMLFALLLVWGFTNAQDTIRVAPDYINGGELNKAIAENGPDKVYLLEVNAFYTLTSTIEFLRPTGNPNAWYHIVGEIPKTAADFMPVIQTGLNAENKPFSHMFTVKADVSFKNIFIANQASTGELGDQNIGIEDDVKLVIDGCTVDPIGRIGFINGNELSGGTRLYVTNNTLLRHGDPYSPNGGHVFWGVYADTMYIENNSIISTDNNVIAGDDATDNIDFLWFNHNTVAFHDVGLLPNRTLPATYVTNNLFYDLTTYVQQHGWAAIDPENGSSGTYPCLAMADTARIAGVLETLPSKRTHLWNRNCLFVSQAVRDTILGAAVKDPTDNQLWQFPVLWNSDVPHYFVTNWAEKGEAILAASRENKMFNSPNFPNFVEDNTLYDMNPNFVDTRIEAFNKKSASSAIYWYRVNKLLKGGNPAVQESQFWDVDKWAGTTAAMYPMVWPRWNGAYTNSTLLKASSDGLPLGDLNAFPEAKALWEKNKVKSTNHILSLNTDQLDLTTGIADKKVSKESSLSTYPNPGKDVITVNSDNALKSLEVYDVSGKLIKKIEMQNSRSRDINISTLDPGVYLLKGISATGENYTRKFVKK